MHPNVPKRSSNGKELSTIPERIGAYRLESPLGRGGMGEVFLAWDERLERPVAIKRIRGDIFLEGRQRERFRREARMAARLSHASIVQIHDLVSDSPGTAGDAIVMEYVEGQTLAERLVRGPLPIADAVRIARQIAEGLAAAHQAGLIHRDLKAENVIVTPAGHAKILDFGLARPISWDGEGLTQHGALVGTCYAMSPEQASGEELDERSDLFSFGALVYQMVAGRSPFRAESPQATLTRVLTATPPPLSEVRPETPPGLSNLVARLLAKDREDRPRNAERAVRSLQEIERELPVAPPLQDSVSEMPTCAYPAASLAEPPETRRSPPPSVWTAPRLRKIALVVAILTAVAGSSLYLIAQRSAPLLRVAVARPEIQPPGDDRLALAASGVLSSVLESLGSLQGISMLDPTMVAGAPTSAQETARSAAADEILVSSLTWERGMARVSMRRIEAEGSRVVWSGSVSVPADPEGGRLLADRIRGWVRQAFAGFEPRSGEPLLEASDRDYAELLEIRRRVESGTSDLEKEIERLGRIVDSSPRFLEAHILAAELGLTRFRSSREPKHLRLARRYSGLARALAPDDPRTLRVGLKIALEDRQAQEAEQILRHLEAQMPGDPEVMVSRALALEKEGRLDEAAEHLRSAIRRAPSWRNIYRLAALETDRGRVSEARGLLERLLHQAPGNAWAQEQLAYLELVYGDLKRAEDLYDKLALANPRHPTHLTNLGLTRSLQGRYPESRRPTAGRWSSIRDRSSP